MSAIDPTSTKYDKNFELALQSIRTRTLNIISVKKTEAEIAMIHMNIFFRAIWEKKRIIIWFASSFIVNL
jgi:hypothetical protein